jgi:N-methylhydantoinase B
MTDSGGAGKFRGGSGTAWEVEPLDKEMLCIGFGEGRRIPAMGAAGAKSRLIDEKVGRVEINRAGDVEVARINILETIKPGQTITNMNPGGGGYGDPFDRLVERVAEDLRNGLVSVRGAAEDYGVVFKNPKTLEVDVAATARLRKR